MTDTKKIKDDIRDGLEIKKSWGLSDFRINDDCVDSKIRQSPTFFNLKPVSYVIFYFFCISHLNIL
jgi:hypothetical protein